MRLLAIDCGSPDCILRFYVSVAPQRTPGPLKACQRAERAGSLQARTFFQGQRNQGAPWYRGAITKNIGSDVVRLRQMVFHCRGCLVIAWGLPGDLLSYNLFMDLMAPNVFQTCAPEKKINRKKSERSFTGISAKQGRV